MEQFGQQRIGQQRIGAALSFVPHKHETGKGVAGAAPPGSGAARPQTATRYALVRPPKVGR